MVKFKSLENGNYHLFCTDCEQPMDVVDGDCVGWLSNNGIEPYCPQCDWLQEDLPPVVLSLNPGETLYLNSPDRRVVLAYEMGGMGLFSEVYVIVCPSDNSPDVYRISQISNFYDKEG